MLNKKILKQNYSDFYNFLLQTKSEIYIENIIKIFNKNKLTVEDVSFFVNILCKGKSNEENKKNIKVLVDNLEELVRTKVWEKLVSINNARFLIKIVDDLFCLEVVSDDIKTEFLKMQLDFLEKELYFYIIDITPENKVKIMKDIVKLKLIHEDSFYALHIYTILKHNEKFSNYDNLSLYLNYNEPMLGLSSLNKKNREEEILSIFNTKTNVNKNQLKTSKDYTIYEIMKKDNLSSFHKEVLDKIKVVYYANTNNDTNNDTDNFTNNIKGFSINTLKRMIDGTSNYTKHLNRELFSARHYQLMFYLIEILEEITRYNKPFIKPYDVLNIFFFNALFELDFYSTEHLDEITFSNIYEPMLALSPNFMYQLKDFIIDIFESSLSEKIIYNNYMRLLNKEINLVLLMNEYYKSLNKK